MEISQELFDDLLKTAGTVLMNASITEDLMCMAFKVLSEIDIKTARAIFYTLDAFQAKKSLLTRMKDVKYDQEESDLIDAIIDAANKSNNQRKDISHSLLMVEGSTLKMFLPKHSEVKSVTADSLKTVRGHSKDAHAESLQAFQKLCAKRGVPARPEW